MNYYKRLKLALRGNIPLMDDIDKDPYTPRKPGDGKGMKMTTMGDENGMGASGWGKNERDGKPERGSSIGKNDEIPINSNVPSPNTMFVPNKEDERFSGSGGIGEGVKDLTFTSPEDPIYQNTLHPTTEPLGPHNMHKYLNVFDRLKARVKGTYNG